MTDQPSRAAKTCHRCGLPGDGRQELVRRRGSLYHSDCLNRLLLAQQIDDIEDLVDMFADPYEVPDDLLEQFANALQAAGNALRERTGTPGQPAQDPAAPAPRTAAAAGGSGAAGGFVFEQAAAEMEQAAQAFRPAGALAVLAAIDHLPDALAHIANVFAILAARCDEAFPIDPRIGQCLAAVHTALTTTVDDAGEIGITFRIVHAADLDRLENPRSGEAMWDTTATAPVRQPAPPAAAGAQPDEVAAAIRQAYRQQRGRHDREWVGLAPLRAALPARYNREQIDQALRELTMARGVHIIPVANLKSLTQADHDAALWLGGEDNHALMIE